MFDRLPKLRYVVLNDNVCVNGIYPVANIDTMRIDLHQNCTENIVHETTDKSVVGKIFSAISKASQNVLKTNTDWFYCALIGSLLLLKGLNKNESNE